MPEYQQKRLELHQKKSELPFFFVLQWGGEVQNLEKLDVL